MSTVPIIKAAGLLCGYARCVVAGPADLELHEGRFICLLGPNGSGKSTLLRTLAALQPALGGRLLLNGSNMAGLKPADIARHISLVLTDPVRPGNLDVYALIALGRYPYTGWYGTLGAPDKKIIEDAIEAAQVGNFLHRKFDQLSDGEAQKVMLARALAQNTPLIMLDEPTAHVDLPSRIRLMQLLHRLSAQAGKCILVSTHELDLALQVADQLWLLAADGSIVAGAPEDLVLSGTFETVFNKEGLRFDKATGSFPVHSANAKATVKLTGEGTHALWTKRALQRAGYHVTAAAGAVHEVIVQEDELRWLYLHNGMGEKHDSIAALLMSLKSYAKEA